MSCFRSHSPKGDHLHADLNIGENFQTDQKWVRTGSYADTAEAAIRTVVMSAC
jgi:hypothetical protein